MAYPIILLAVIAILTGLLLAGRGDLTGRQRRNTLIGLGVAAAAMVLLLVYFVAIDGPDTDLAPIELRVVAALEEQDPAELAELTRFAQQSLGDDVARARGFLIDGERRLVMCVESGDGSVHGVYMQRNPGSETFDRRSRVEQSIRTELAAFCARAL